MTIRKANKEDINNNILNLYIHGFRFHYNGRPDIFRNKTDEELKESLLDELDKLTFLVLEDTSIKGYIAYHIKDKRDKILWIDEFIIDEKFRHQGYGKMLIDKVIEIAKEEKCKRVELDVWSFNNNAIDMYKHIGFDKQREMLEINI